MVYCVQLVYTWHLCTWYILGIHVLAHPRASGVSQTPGVRTGLLGVAGDVPKGVPPGGAAGRQRRAQAISRRSYHRAGQRGGGGARGRARVHVHAYAFTGRLHSKRGA